MEMLTQMAKDQKERDAKNEANSLSMEARIKQDIRETTEQVENRLTTTMQGKTDDLQADINSLKKANLDQAAELEKLRESHIKIEAEQARSRADLTNNQNEESIDLYNRQVYVHNLAKIFPSIANSKQIRNPGMREDIANFLEIQFDKDEPPTEEGDDAPLNETSRFKNAVRIIDIVFFKPKSPTAKEGDILPCIITLNHAITARRFRQTYQGSTWETSPKLPSEETQNLTNWQQKLRELSTLSSPTTSSERGTFDPR